ncbi:MAG: helix-turn-helix transcriptional regulator [Candidatus Aminicenantes bacterium]|nr:helix-turn-helix transcriptional regulator [Candidatus Aminicenantes bacterium]
MKTRKRKNGENAEKYYHISSVARMFNVHPQTLRLYEREGLLMPSRSDGNTRLYSDMDLKRLELILNLTRDLGVNLAGVEVVLNMRQKMERIEAEVNEFLEYVQKEFFDGREDEFERKRRAIIPMRPAMIVRIEKATEDGE